MRNRLFGLLLIAGLSLYQSTSPRAQQTGTAAAPLPPVVYVCTMPGDEAVLEDKPGVCPNPKCGMQLVPTRLDSKWWCPVHQSLEVRDGPGKCRRDGRDLVQVTLAMSWTCPGSDNKLIDPGKCADGSPRKVKYEIRAHGDHNPKHGGSFFMAEDKWHHVEGTYVNGLFKIYFYDNFTKPMSAKEFTGQAVLQDKMFKDLESWPLKLGADGVTMEARIPAAKAALPINLAARITFGTGQKSNLFNFPFTKYSAEPTTPTGAVATPGKPVASRVEFLGVIASADRATVAKIVAANDYQDPSMPAQTPRVLDSPLQISAELANALDEEKLPKTTADLVKLLDSRTKEIETLVKEGSLGSAWLPAMGTKTVAIVLADHAKELPEAQQAVVNAAAKRVVNSAWEIDAYGDLGNHEKVVEAFQRLATAVNELKGAYASAR